MRRRGDVDEMALPCNTCPLLSRPGKGLLPPRDEASHPQCLSVRHGVLEESPTTLHIISAATLQMRYPQFGARLECGRAVAQARAGCHCRTQVVHSEIEFATRQGGDPQRAVDGA